VTDEAKLARRGVELHEQVRSFLIGAMPYESPAAIACALMYEVASIIATVTETEAEAQALLRHTCAIAAEQITQMGVGRPHP